MRVCLVSTFPPRPCGIATFAARLRESLLATPGIDAVDVVAVVRDHDVAAASAPGVVTALRQDDLADYRRVAHLLNSRRYDVVSIQHEFGIFGGDAGIHVAELAGKLAAPVVTTLHTVLGSFPEPLHRALAAVADASEALVVLTDAALPLLGGVPTLDHGGPLHDRVQVVPHGVPDVPLTDPAGHKAELGLEGRFVVLTFGLLSAGKGLEQVIAALPAVARAHPEVCYVVLGATHPEVRRHEGERYREHLESLVQELDLSRHVRFVDRYVGEEELLRHLAACDVYVTPYLSAEQIASGTLAYAVGTGRACVSTPYRYARDLLADGVGRLVDFGDVDAMAAALGDLAADDAARARLRERAHARGRAMTWASVGKGYARLFSDVAMGVELRRAHAALDRLAPADTGSLAALRALTDDVGVLQHTRFGIPDRAHGYTTDDNARALLAVVGHAAAIDRPAAEELTRRYLAFLTHAQNPDGSFRNLMSYDRRWLDDRGTQDTQGQAVWGLATAIRHAPDDDVRDLATGLLTGALATAADLTEVRSVAYALCGLTQLIGAHEGGLAFPSDLARPVEQVVDTLATRLVQAYARSGSADWRWCDTALTYASAKVPEALLRAGLARQRPDWRRLGLESLDFVLAQMLRGTGGPVGTEFVPVGNDGWYPRDGVCARYGQQPIEAGYTVQACSYAFEVTGVQRYRTAGRAAMEWLLGRNAFGVALYDPHTGRCSDGLDRAGPSRNSGAESVICALLAMQAWRSGTVRRTTARPLPSRFEDGRPARSGA